MLGLRHSRWAAATAASLAIGLALAATAREAPTPAGLNDVSFGPPQPVEISGYTGDAMEPFVTRDGRWLMFNTRNSPRDQTDLMLARRIDDRRYALVGALTGANSASLDGVASVDRAGRFFFVSNRDYDRSGNTLWTGRFANGLVSEVRPLATDFTPKKLLRLNIDLEISADGSILYVAENRWNLFRGRPSKSRLAVARRNGNSFERQPDSDWLMKAINGAALDYAPATSSDQLTLAFTRWNPRRSADTPHLMISRRASAAVPWNDPQLIIAAAGFVEGATFLPGDCAILYHARIGEAYRLFVIRGKRC